MGLIPLSQFVYLFCQDPPFPLYPLILAGNHKIEKQSIIKMECDRLSGGLWMSRHIFKVEFQPISLPAKVHLSVVGGVKRGCGAENQ